VVNRSIFILLLGLAVVSGCSKLEEHVPVDGKPVIYTVNYPLAYIAERIAGEHVNVNFPEVDGDPAFWNPPPEEIVEYQNADLILLNGASYAKWVPKVSLPQSTLVDTSAKFTDRFIALDEAGNHTHGPAGAHVHGDVAFTTWLDPQLAIQQAAAIRDAFSRQWKKHAADFESGFQSLEKELLDMDAELEKEFSRIGHAPLVGSHPVYQYLIRRYSLNLQSVHWEPDQVPDSTMLRELDDMMEGHPATVMLWEAEPLQESKVLLAEKGIQSLVFNPCGNRPAEGDYHAVMQRNIQCLEKNKLPLGSEEYTE
jgi:zinc transport system substrate-binding protein